MPVSRFTRLRPGQMPSAEDWNTLVDALEQLDRVNGTAGSGVGIARGAGGITVLDGRTGGHWAKITSRGTGNHYAHHEVIPDGAGGWIDPGVGADGFAWGTTTSADAREANGRVDFDGDLPLYVWLTPDETEGTPGFVFVAPATAGSRGFHARLTSTSTISGVARWNYVRLTLDADGAWADSGSESTGYPAVPSTIDGTEYAWAAAGLRVWLTPSSQSGLYEFRPVAFADATHGGLLTGGPSLQQIGGPKQFVDGAQVNDYFSAILAGTDPAKVITLDRGGYYLKVTEFGGTGAITGPFLLGGTGADTYLTVTTTAFDGVDHAAFRPLGDGTKPGAVSVAVVHASDCYYATGPSPGFSVRKGDGTEGITVFGLYMDDPDYPDGKVVTRPLQVTKGLVTTIDDDDFVAGTDLPAGGIPLAAVATPSGLSTGPIPPDAP